MLKSSINGITMLSVIVSTNEATETILRIMSITQVLTVTGL